jgi:hypothetical protein
MPSESLHRRSRLPGWQQQQLLLLQRTTSASPVICCPLVRLVSAAMLRLLQIHLMSTVAVARRCINSRLLQAIGVGTVRTKLV